MNYFNALDIAKAYSGTFQNKRNVWLACHRKVDITYCRCMDCVELSVAIMWLSDSPRSCKTSLNLPNPYLVGVIKEDLKLPWCRASEARQGRGESDKLHFVAHHEIKEKLLGSWYCSPSGDKLLLSILCIYLVNTQNERRRLMELYLISNWDALCDYIKALNTNKQNFSNLQEHILLLKEVLAWYGGSGSNILFPWEDVVDVLYSREVRINLGLTLPDVLFLKSKLESVYQSKFNKEVVGLNYKMIEGVLNIAIYIKNLSALSWETNKKNFLAIYNNLCIIKKNTKSGGKKIDAALDRLCNLIYNERV